MRLAWLVAAGLSAALPAAVAAQQQAARCRVQLVFANDSGGVLGPSYFAQLRRNSLPIVLRCRPVTRAISAFE